MPNRSLRTRTKLSSFSRGGLGGDVPAPGFFAGQGLSLQPVEGRELLDAVAEFEGIESKEFSSQRKLGRPKVFRGPEDTPEPKKKRQKLSASLGFRGFGGGTASGRSSTILGSGNRGSRTRLG